MIRLARASAVAASALAVAAAAIALAAPARDAGPGAHVTAVSAATASGRVTSARPALIPAMPHALLPVGLTVTPATGSLAAGQAETIVVTATGTDPPRRSLLTINPGPVTITVIYSPVN